MSNVVELPQTKTDKEAAEEFKTLIMEAYKPITEVLTKCKKAGFEVQVGIGPNAFGQYVITQLVIAKHF